METSPAAPQAARMASAREGDEAMVTGLQEEVDAVGCLTAFLGLDLSERLIQFLQLQSWLVVVKGSAGAVFFIVICFNVCSHFNKLQMKYRHNVSREA